MSGENLPVIKLIDKLSDGWSSSQTSLTNDFIHYWKEKFNTFADIKGIDNNMIYFDTKLNIYLRGMDEIPCLLIGGNDSNYIMQNFLNSVSGKQCIPFVLTLSNLAYKHAMEFFPNTRYLILSPEEIKNIFSNIDGFQVLKRYLRERISRRRLVPYTILHHVKGNMFFGRRKELDLLKYEDETSFIVAGPGRIGKSSLIQQYKYEKKKEGESYNLYVVDFYNCGDKTPKGIARFLAMKIEPSNISSRMKVEELFNFLKYQRSKYGGQLELLLDEVDEVCEGEVFQVLGSAARQGICRLIIGGRGVLLKLALDKNSPLQSRLDLIILQTFDKESAKDLLIKPLEDLGFNIEDPDCLSDNIFNFTGGLPHLIQLFGKKLTQIADEEKTNTITINHFETLKLDFELAQYMMSPLGNAISDEVRRIAMALLKDGRKEFKIQDVQSITAKCGINLDYHDAFAICNYLFINNILIWDKGSYRIANEALSYYAKEQGLI